VRTSVRVVVDRYRRIELRHSAAVSFMSVLPADRADRLSLKIERADGEIVELRIPNDTLVWWGDEETR